MIRRHFLDWDEPVSVKVTDYLLADGLGGTVDLSEVLVVVPTRQAGRRLRQHLLKRCAAGEVGLFPPRIETPSFFITPSPGSGRPASVTEELRCWIAVLLAADLEDYEAFSPVPPAVKDFSWALRTGRILQGLRTKLAEGGYLFADVASLTGKGLEEEERWEDLAALEGLYLSELAACRLQDLCRLQIDRASRPSLPAGIERLVVAAVADPIPLSIKAMERLQTRLDIEVLVHAPQEKRKMFDHWGRPLQEKWPEARIEIDRPEESILLVGSPQAQCSKVIEVLAGEQHNFSPADTGIGVADAALAPSLVRVLRENRLQAYDPAGIRMRDHVLNSLLEALSTLLQEGGFEALAAFLRHADVLSRFARFEKWPVPLLLENLDRLQNEYLPQTAAYAMQRLAGRVGGGDGIAALQGAFSFVRRWINDFERLPVDEAIEKFLTVIFEGRQIDQRRKDDRDFGKAAARVRTVLEEFRCCREKLAGYSAAQNMELFLSRLASFSFYPEHDDAAIELDGWLELPWLETPLLLVSGMNEGMVPSSRLGDPFLPDSLCRRLGIRNNKSLFARDVFLLTTLVESRKKKGRIYFFVGRTSSRGEPLLPSRLLFMVSDRVLPKRAALLFREIDEPKPAVARSPGFTLLPDQAERKGEIIEKLPVTAFRDYLSCPFRFFLKHVLGMEPMDDRKDEMDSLDFGSLAHAALEILGRNPARHWTDAVKLAGLLGEFVQEEGRRRYGSAPPLQVTIQLTSLINRLEAAARHHVGMIGEGWQVERVETDREMSVEGMIIRGRIDRIDRHQESGRFRIIDYKTGEKASLPEKVHLGAPVKASIDFALFEEKGKTKRWIDLQLPLYFLLLAEDGVTSENCEAGYFNLPKALSETAYVPWISFRPVHLRKAADCMTGVIDAIRKKRFWPPAEKVQYDPYASLFYDDPHLVFREPGR